ncbi:MAG: RecQ family ATP-dependent DNA helicase [Myxococcales bacterium]|nr:RecQ family ATP-dependent DNA helicase [Myxococcales bacterium]
MFSADTLLPLLRQTWGFDAFLPSQAEAIDAIVAGRDTLVVMPTGGGKSLTYQLPALALPGTAIVVSPLLALMKDQVDALTHAGVSAATLNSTTSAESRAQIVRRYETGELKLLYVSPEGLATGRLQDVLRLGRVSFIAVDEAHCISQWGHEYRSDYRNLALMRDLFPDAAMHAFTATATPRVREDIALSLRMADPVRVVGSFHRPNLTYRAVQRTNLTQQLQELIARHPGDAGIVYAIRRKDVEEIAAALAKVGVRALPYHAGMTPEVRQRHQEAFSSEAIDVIVATIAFGMGIDRSNVRFVAHAGLPRSIENYQQEAGRAGRDRLPAECVLFHSAQDLIAWRNILGELVGEVGQAAERRLQEVQRFAVNLACRHRYLVEYFGEPFAASESGCSACDVCLGECTESPDSATLAKKLLSAVVRVEQRFGAHYVADVLRGAKREKIEQFGHDRLSTFGLMKEFESHDIVSWLDQLLGQGFLDRGPMNTLVLTREGWHALRGERPVRLSVPRGKPARRTKAGRGGSGADVAAPGSATHAIDDTVSAALFDALRLWRRETARLEKVAPFVVFSDAVLMGLIARRPLTLQALRACPGIGDRRLELYGDALLGIFRALPPEARGGVEALPDPRHVTPPPEAASAGGAGPSEGDAGVNDGGMNDAGVSDAGVNDARVASATLQTAFAAFDLGCSISDVMVMTTRARSTVERYFHDWVEDRRPTSASPWLEERELARVETAIQLVGRDRLKPLHEHLALEEPLDYAMIRLALRVIDARKKVAAAA